MTLSQISHIIFNMTEEITGEIPQEEKIHELVASIQASINPESPDSLVSKWDENMASDEKRRVLLERLEPLVEHTKNNGTPQQRHLGNWGVKLGRGDIFVETNEVMGHGGAHYDFRVEDDSGYKMFFGIYLKDNQIMLFGGRTGTPRPDFLVRKPLDSLTRDEVAIVGKIASDLSTLIGNPK